jgi:hypothetical protein
LFRNSDCHIHFTWEDCEEYLMRFKCLFILKQIS